MALSKPMYSIDRSVQSQPYKVKRPNVWHGYLLSQDERRRIDNMMGRALLDDAFCEQLVYHRTSALLSEFGLSATTQEWLCAMEVSSLAELAQAIAL